MVKTKKAPALEWTEIAAALGCKVPQAKARIVALGYTEWCGRCGGSGHYSFNRIDGTTCFDCRGRKERLVKITALMLDEIKAKIAAGGLTDYFARCKRIADAKAATRALKAQVDAAWKDGAVHAAYKAADRGGKGVTYEVSHALTHAIVTSQLFNGVGLVNAAWSLANRIEDWAAHGEVAAEDAAAQMAEVLAAIVEANAYAMEHAAEMMQPADHIHAVRG